MSSSKTAAATVAGEGIAPHLRRAAMTALLLAVTVATLDTAITNTALPTIAADLNADASTSIWVVSAYQLAVVASLLPLAALGEIFGQRRVYVAGLGVFTVASLLCGLAWSLPVLAGARAVQGLGAAAIMSSNLALIRFIYPSAKLGSGLGLNALTVGLSFTVGPTVASAILSLTTWHWLFLINIPVGMLSFTLAWRSLPRTPLAGHRFDPLAAVLSAAMFSLIIFGVDAAGHGADWGMLAGEWLLAAFCCWALLKRQASHPAPMLAMDLLRRPIFALSAATSICAFTAQGVAYVALPFLFQRALGRSQVESGFLLTPFPAVTAMMAPIAGRLADRFSTGLLGGIGLLTLSAGMAGMALLPADPSAFDIGWRLALCGGGFGFFQSPNLKAIMGSAPKHRSGGASGIVSTSRLLGQATGAALVSVCFEISEARGPVLALWLGCGFAAAGSAASLLRELIPKPKG